MAEPTANHETPPTQTQLDYSNDDDDSEIEGEILDPNMKETLDLLTATLSAQDRAANELAVKMKKQERAFATGEITVPMSDEHSRNVLLGHLYAIQNQEPSDVLSKLREELQKAHESNWQRFKSKLTPELKKPMEGWRLEELNTACFLPSFKRKIGGNEVQGLCEWCHGFSVLCLLLKQPVDLGKRRDWKTVGLEEVLGRRVVCDGCAAAVLGLGLDLVGRVLGEGERIVGAVPLVGMQGNEEAWVWELDRVWGRWSHGLGWCFGLFLMVFEAAGNRKWLVGDGEGEREDGRLRECLRWVWRELKGVCGGEDEEDESEGEGGVSENVGEFSWNSRQPGLEKDTNSETLGLPELGFDTSEEEESEEEARGVFRSAWILEEMHGVLVKKRKREDSDYGEELPLGERRKTEHGNYELKYAEVKKAGSGENEMYLDME